VMRINREVLRTIVHTQCGVTTLYKKTSKIYQKKSDLAYPQYKMRLTQRTVNVKFI
jgi:hypothetical protein